MCVVLVCSVYMVEHRVEQWGADMKESTGTIHSGVNEAVDRETYH